MYDYYSFWLFLVVFISVVMGGSILVNWVFRTFLQREQEE